MNLCHDGHDEICFEGHDCPLCSVISEKDHEIGILERDNARLESEVSDLESKVDDLTGELTLANSQSHQ